MTLKLDDLISQIDPQTGVSPWITPDVLDYKEDESGTSFKLDVDFTGYQLGEVVAVRSVPPNPATLP